MISHVGFGLSIIIFVKGDARQGMYPQRLKNRTRI